MSIPAAWPDVPNCLGTPLGRIETRLPLTEARNLTDHFEEPGSCQDLIFSDMFWGGCSRSGCRSTGKTKKPRRPG